MNDSLYNIFADPRSNAIALRVFSRMFFRLYSFFFFSSRRRHTRYIGDWSSDVCSSDLNDGGRSVAILKGPDVNDAAYDTRKAPLIGGRSIGVVAGVNGWTAAEQRMGERSEERRVGKECRSRWSTDE